MTIGSTLVQPHHNLMPSGLTACAVIAGPSLVGAAEAAPAVTLVSVAIGLTALVIGFALRQHRPHMALAAAARSRIATARWSRR